MSDVNDTTIWGSIAAGIGGIGWGIFQFRKTLRKDGQESSASDVVITANGAVKDIIEELRKSLSAANKKLEDLGTEMGILKDKVEVWMRAHTECQQENRRLMLENATLKKMIPHDEQDPIGGMTP